MDMEGGSPFDDLLLLNLLSMYFTVIKDSVLFTELHACWLPLNLLCSFSSFANLLHTSNYQKPIIVIKILLTIRWTRREDLLCFRVEFLNYPVILTVRSFQQCPWRLLMICGVFSILPPPNGHSFHNFFLMPIPLWGWWVDYEMFSCHVWRPV